MDFALTSILLIFLLLPGLVFRRFYYTEEFSKEYFKESIPSFFLSVTLPSTIIHILCWNSTRGYILDIQTWGTLISGTDDPKAISDAFKSIYQSIKPILQYILYVTVLSAFLGWFSKFIVRFFKLDRRIKLFRFQNEWHYLFSGEILDFPRVLGRASSIDFKYVDALVNTADGTIIYMGMLQDYVLSKDGGIDRIYLTNVKRRYLSADRKPKEESVYHLPGEFFVIPFSQILNLHLTYYSVNLNMKFEQEVERMLKHMENPDYLARMEKIADESEGAGEQNTEIPDDDDTNRHQNLNTREGFKRLLPSEGGRPAVAPDG